MTTRRFVVTSSNPGPKQKFLNFKKGKKKESFLPFPFPITGLYPMPFNLQTYLQLHPESHSGVSFLAFAIDFPMESLLGISLLLALLYLSFQLGQAHSFSDKKELSLTWSNWLRRIINIHILVLLISRGLLTSFEEVHFNSFLISNFYITFLQLMVLGCTTFILSNSQKTIVTNPNHHLMEYPFLLAASS